MQLDFSPALEQLQDMIDNFIGAIPNIITAILIVVLITFFSRWIRVAVTRVSDRYRRAANLGLVLGRLSQWMTVLFGLLVAAVILFPNFSAARMIELLGIGTVAIGFAFRDILQNFLAGILLLLTEPFRIGDQIIASEYEGTVEEIQTRATMIRTYDGRRVVIPNADLFNAPVVVNTAFAYRRLEYDIGIGYTDNVDTARQIILATLAQLDDVLSTPAPDVLVVDLMPYTVNLRIRWWIEPPRISDALEARDHVLTAVKRELIAGGIDLPFPTYQVLLSNHHTVTNH